MLLNALTRGGSSIRCSDSVLPDFMALLPVVRTAFPEFIPRPCPKMGLTRLHVGYDLFYTLYLCIYIHFSLVVLCLWHGQGS